MRLIISFAALFLSVLLLQLSSGGVGPLDALSGLELGFTTTQIGLLGSAHFFGFFIGCWWAPRLMGSVGHSRAFAAFTATGAIGLLAHMLVVDPYAWTLMRVMSGLCVAGCYTVIEAWMQDKVTNETRGRTTGAYRVVDMSGSLVAQLMIGVLAPASYVSYNILAILCCAAILPLTLTTTRQPETPEAPRLRPWLAQFPVGLLADKYDRRWVLIWLSVAAIASSALTMGAQGFGTVGVMGAAFIFGLTTFPIYSIASSHAHDFADSAERVELSAALMFFYALGAIAAPFAASSLITAYGPDALFTMIAIGHVILVIFGIARMRARPSATTRTPYLYAPRTSFLIGRLMGRSRDNPSSKR